MAEPSKQSPRTVWLGLSLAFGMLGLVWFVGLMKMAQTSQAALPVISQIADFTLTNQDGKITTLADLTNHVWVADIIFTRCAGPCPRMTAQMKMLQDALPQTSAAKLVTLTTDPGFDTPPVLKKYGERFDADFNRWPFLTGTKAEIATLAAGSLKLSAVPVKPADQQNAADLFIHTTIFVVVDKHAQMRAIFETGGDGVNWAEDVAPRLLKTIAQLEREP